MLPRDITPPVTTFSITSSPNALGWNHTDGSIALSATNDITGDAKTAYNLDGAGVVRYTGSIVIATEGVHVLRFFSVDNSQNVEHTKEVIIRIVKTPRHSLQARLPMRL
jgi:hypothetical protein